MRHTFIKHKDAKHGQVEDDVLAKTSSLPGRVIVGGRKVEGPEKRVDGQGSNVQNRNRHARGCEDDNGARGAANIRVVLSRRTNKLGDGV